MVCAKDPPVQRKSKKTRTTELILQNVMYLRVVCHNQRMYSDLVAFDLLLLTTDPITYPLGSTAPKRTSREAVEEKEAPVTPRGMLAVVHSVSRCAPIVDGC